MGNPIVKKLNKKPHPGVSRFMFMDRRRGEKDYKNSQLCIDGTRYSTPWIMERFRSLAEYEHKIYGQVDKALESIAHTIGSEYQELKSLTPQKRWDDLDKENQARVSVRAAAMEERKTAIMIQLSEMQMDLETIDVALKHHIQRAESIVMQHVSAYWSGILKAAADNTMPSVPEVEIPEIPGKAVYEMHMNKIRELLNKVLADENQEV